MADKTDKTTKPSTATTDATDAKPETAPRIRAYPETISPLVDLWRATGDARYLDAARAQGDALLADIAPPAAEQGAPQE